MMLRGEVLDVGPDNVVYVKIPQKYGNDSVKAVTRISVSKGDLVYVTDTSVSRVPQWVVFDQMNAVGSWGSAYPHTHPLGQVDGLVSRLEALAAAADDAKKLASQNDTSSTVESFGAVGDGKTIDTVAIQAALDNAEGRPVEFSKEKTYLIDGPLYVPSNSRVNGNGCTLRGSKFMSSALILAGEAATQEINTVGNYNSGDTTITTSTSHNLTVGETFRIVGQRQIASIDAPSDDRLGMATGNKNGPWNGEYLTVRAVAGPTKVSVSTGLIFNAYRDNKTQETHEQARSRTTINQMNWHENTIVQDFDIEASTSNCVRLEYCKDVTLRNIRDHKTNTIGATVSMVGCYRCTADECYGEYKGPIPDTVQYYQRNLFKLVSSQNCVIERCKSDGGGQIVDMTYLQSAKIPTIACVVRDCVFYGYDDNGVTTHPGVWGAIIQDNDLRANNEGEKSSGIGIRSPYSVITGNHVSSVPRDASTNPFVSAGNYGVHMYDGGGHHCTISNNDISGFDLGIAMSDGGHDSGGERHGELNNLITGNQIRETYFGVLFRKSGKAPSSIFSAVMVSNNQITSKINGAVGVQTDVGDSATRAPVISGNHFHLTGTNPIPVRIGKNTMSPVLVGNTVTGTSLILYETQAGASNGTISTSGNTVITTSKVHFFDR